jgi:hypothetical protein
MCRSALLTPHLLASSLACASSRSYMGEKHEHYSLYSVHPEFTRVRGARSHGGHYEVNHGWVAPCCLLAALPN